MTQTTRGLSVLQVGPLYVNHVRRWTEHAVALGCTVHVAGHVRPGRGAADFGELAESVDLLPSTLLRADQAQKTAWLRRVVERVAPDLIQAHWLSTWGCFSTLTGHPRVVLTPWGSDVYLASGTGRSRGDFALRRAPKVLARSEHMRRELLARGADSTCVERVDLGVDLDRFRPADSAARSGARRALGLGEGPVVMSLRAGLELYNIDVVIDAFRLVRTGFPNATLLLLLGDAPPCRRVRWRLRRIESDAVRVVRRISHTEMALHVAAADVAVSIPSSDGSPNTVWEALASGVPAVLSDLPQLRERIGESDAALLVPPRADAVAAAVCQALVERAAMACAAREWAVANVDQRAQTPRLDAVYASIARSAASAGALSASER